MTDKMKVAIDTLAEKLKNSSSSNEALHYSQAALNMAHVAATFVGIELQQKQQQQ